MTNKKTKKSSSGGSGGPEKNAESPADNVVPIIPSAPELELELEPNSESELDPATESDSVMEQEPLDEQQTSPEEAPTAELFEERREDYESEIAALESEISNKDSEITNLKDQLLRTMAEIENTRRRLSKERDDAAKFGAAALAKEMLNVADNLRRALEAIPEDALKDNATLKALAEGVQLTEEDLKRVFERNGIEIIDPLGERFDHNRHQAMFELENTGHPPGTVAQVLAPGYILRDRLLRPAMVGVAKGEPQKDKKKHVDTSA